MYMHCASTFGSAIIEQHAPWKTFERLGCWNRHLARAMSRLAPEEPAHKSCAIDSSLIQLCLRVGRDCVCSGYPKWPEGHSVRCTYKLSPATVAI